MKICFFTKYPPIEGGVSAQTYWLSKALGEKGIEIHIVTNALEVEEAFKEKLDLENLEELKNYLPPNVFVHNLESVFRNLRFSHIPQSPAYLERLINKGLEVFINHKCDLIDSFYILPYGLAGFITKPPFKKGGAMGIFPVLAGFVGAEPPWVMNRQFYSFLFLESFPYFFSQFRRGQIIIPGHGQELGRFK